MKILIVFTGGTIGSSVKNGIADVDSDTSRLLLDLYKDKSDIEFECISPFNILSENSTCNTLSEICSFMLKIDFEKYNGVIVTHGSDTLAYTSAMLGLVLSWVKIPVVITAADYVLTSPHSNGISNFKASVDFITNFTNVFHNNAGVFTIWKNRDENVKVYISTRLNEADGFLDSFSAWGGAEFGIIESGHFKRTDSIINPNCTKPCEKIAFLRRRNITFDNNILLLQSYVGLDFNAVNITEKAAVLLRLYHSATACTEGGATSFSKFTEKCFENNVDVYIYPTKETDYRYQSTENINYSKIIPLNNINTTSAYCKILLAYAIEKERREELIFNNLFYEMLK